MPSFVLLPKLLHASLWICLLHLTCSNVFSSRSVRVVGLYSFCGMIACTTNRSCFDFNNYGCFCGVLGHGRPVDDIDGCCRSHDLCYRLVRRHEGCWPAWTHYKWTCESGSLICEKLRTSWCQKAICECDRSAAECFSRHQYPSGGKPNCTNSFN